jgi:hypothetical protein
LFNASRELFFDQLARAVSALRRSPGIQHEKQGRPIDGNNGQVIYDLPSRVEKYRVLPGFANFGTPATKFNLDARVADSARGVLEQQPLLFGAHLPEQDAGLLVVIIGDAMVPIVRR